MVNMSENSTKEQNQLFQINWAEFNVIAGIKFALVTLVMMLLTQFTDFDFLIILIAALLAWLTDVPGSTKTRISGMIAFAVAGIAMIWLAAAVYEDVLLFTTTMFVVAFVFTLPMAMSQRAYMVGWSAILLFFSIAPMTINGELASFSWDILIGVAAVVLVTLFWPAGIGPYGQSKTADAKDAGGVEDHTFVVVYSITVAIVLAVAIFIGLQVLTVGAVWIANGAFFVLGPSTRQSWVHGIERAVVVVVGIVLGLLLVDFIDSTLVLTALWVVFAFLALAALNAGYALSIGSYTAGMTMTWAVQGLDVGQLNSGERILAEALAIGLAIVATAFLQWWANHRQVETHVEAELAA
jgi:hypothetical protein